MKRGFALVELALALAVFAIITALLVGYQVEDYKRELARKYAGGFVAIDQALFTMYMQVISYNNSLSVPVCQNGSLGTLVNAKNGWAGQSPYSGVVAQSAIPLSYLDPRVDPSKYRLVVNGGRVVGIQLSDVQTASMLSDWLTRLLPLTPVAGGQKGWDPQSKTFLGLNNGQGYPANIGGWPGCQ